MLLEESSRTLVPPGNPSSLTGSSNIPTAVQSTVNPALRPSRNRTVVTPLWQRHRRGHLGTAEKCAVTPGVVVEWRGFVVEYTGVVEIVVESAKRGIDVLLVIALATTGSRLGMFGGEWSDSRSPRVYWGFSNSSTTLNSSPVTNTMINTQNKRSDKAMFRTI